MEIKTARFVLSSVDYRKCPEGKLPEYAFIGRSNVGKSSLINLLTGLKGLAKISVKPGKTQLINHFIINENSDSWYLVDLPGYGFAQVSKSIKDSWSKFVKDYLLHRKNLLCVFVLIDSRHKPQNLDMEAMEWLAKHNIPFVMVFTKIDKLTKVKFQENIDLYNKKMLKYWEELPAQFFSSAFKKEGKKEILDFIEETNRIIKNKNQQNTTAGF